MTDEGEAVPPRGEPTVLPVTLAQLMRRVVATERGRLRATSTLLELSDEQSEPVDRLAAVLRLRRLVLSARRIEHQSLALARLREKGSV